MNQPDQSCQPCSLVKLVALRLFGSSCRVLMIVTAIAAFLLCLPWLLEETSLRDQVLAGIINIDSVNVHSRAGSCGYRTPCSVEGLRIESKNATTLIDVERIESEYSWLELWLSKPELGKFEVQHPKIDICVPSKPRSRGSTAGRPRTASESKPSGKTRVLTRFQKGFVKLPIITAEIQDAELAIRNGVSPEPTIDLNDLDVTFRIERHDDQPVLKIEPTTLFDHHRLTPKSFRGGMQLVAPLLSTKLDAEGEFTVRLTEFEVPMGQTRRPHQREREMRIGGEIEFHRASIALKDSIVSKMSEVVNRLTFYSGPNRIYVQRGTKVRVRMVNGRVYHQGLSLLLPFGDSAFQFVSSGSVGIDESLDLYVAVHPPLGPLKHTFIARRMREDPIVVRFGGTLDDPRLVLPVRMEFVESTLEQLIPRSTPEEFDRQMSDILDGMVRGTSETVKPILKKPVFMRMRSRFKGIPFFRK